MIFLAVTGYLFFYGDFSVGTLLESKKNEDIIKNRIAELKNRIEEQRIKNELLKNRDSFEMEKKAREIGMVKTGEKIYRYEVK